MVKANVTTRDALSTTLRQLNDVGARILGGIMNAVDFSGGHYGKGYYYRGYGEYYAAADDDDETVEEAAE